MGGIRLLSGVDVAARHREWDEGEDEQKEKEDEQEEGAVKAFRRHCESPCPVLGATAATGR